MFTATLSQLVTMVRAEAGYALSVAQGLNTVETLKHIIRRTEIELWEAFPWDLLTIRAELPTPVGVYLFDFPADMNYDQVRQVYWTSGDKFGDPLSPHICEEHIIVGGANSTKGSPQEWQLQGDQLRVWPTPSVPGTLRLKGQKYLNELVDEADTCTLDATMISLFAAAEVLERAGAKDAQGKMQKAQRHLAKLRGNQNKVKVSTFGAGRPAHRGPGHTYIRNV